MTRHPARQQAGRTRDGNGIDHPFIEQVKP
jgi:hypothetical protein